MDARKGVVTELIEDRGANVWIGVECKDNDGKTETIFVSPLHYNPGRLNKGRPYIGQEGMIEFMVTKSGQWFYFTSENTKE